MVGSGLLDGDALPTFATASLGVYVVSFDVHAA